MKKSLISLAMFMFCGAAFSVQWMPIVTLDDGTKVSIDVTSVTKPAARQRQGTIRWDSTGDSSTIVVNCTNHTFHVPPEQWTKIHYPSIAGGFENTTCGVPDSKFGY